MYPFFAFVKRMKHVRRWSLMRNVSDENLMEHSHETAMIAHALAVIGNTYFGKNYNPEKAALFAVYHDATEVITGDLPTPVKYRNDNIRKAYKDIEKNAGEEILGMLPAEMQPRYKELFSDCDCDEYRLMKQADKLSAYIKCVEERESGNKEFVSAEKTIYKELKATACEETEFFLKEFMPAYELDIDRQK